MKKLFNVLSGKTYKWNSIANPIMESIDLKIQKSDLANYAAHFTPFVYGGALLVDDYLHPYNRINQDIVYNIKHLTSESYFALIEIAISALIQLFLNLPNEDSELKEIVKNLFTECIKDNKIEFSNLPVNQFEGLNSINLNQISTYLVAELRIIIKAKPAKFLQDQSAYAYLGETFKMVQDLRLTNKMPSLFSN